MANSPIQNQAAITAAVQAAAIADLVLLETFLATNGPSFATLSANFSTLAGQMSSLARQQQVTAIMNQLNNALADFNTLISTTTNAITAVPVA